MKTHELIENLSRDLSNPSESKNWFARYWLTLAGCFSFMTVFTYVASVYLPNDIHLPHHLTNTAFWVETSAWFLISILSAVIAYKSSIGGGLNIWFGRIAMSLSAILFISLSVRWSVNAFAQEFTTEMHLTQGPCGVFIGVAGFLSLVMMVTVIRKGMPTNLGYTAAWSAASVGTLASGLMHMVCTHENSVHVFMWHMLPLIALIGVASSLSQRLLRW